MAKPRNPVIDLLQYAGLRMVSMTLHCFPVEMNLRTARLLADLVYRFDRKHRHRALMNLRRSFPELSDAEHDQLARQSVEQLIMLFVEILFTTRLVHLHTWANYVELVDFEPVLDMLLRRDRPIVLLTGHYGNWEILGYVLATLGFDTTSVARPLDNPYVNRWLLGVREKKGQRIVDKKGATTDVARVLRGGGAVGFIADQNAGTKGLFVDFFGRKASTYKSIGLVAMEFEAPVVIGYARRKSEAFRFEVGAQDIIYPEQWQDQPDPLRYITQRYTAAIEEMVRIDPGQYLWVHRRWKTRPKGEVAEPYD